MSHEKQLSVCSFYYSVETFLEEKNYTVCKDYTIFYKISRSYLSKQHILLFLYENAEANAGYINPSFYCHSKSQYAPFNYDVIHYQL